MASDGIISSSCGAMKWQLRISLWVISAGVRVGKAEKSIVDELLFKFKLFITRSVNNWF